MDQENLWKSPLGSIPLAERLRPGELDAVLGQQHVLAKGAVLRKAIEEDRLFSCIFYGPPGCGKTTVGHIIAKKTSHPFTHFSAARSSMSQLKPVLEEASLRSARNIPGTIVFVDEIHRFNKLQQDVLLPYVENGEIILVGATTENPSFELNPALLSRCKVFTFRPLANQDLLGLLQRAWEMEKPHPSAVLDPEAQQWMVDWSGGDARTLLNQVEILAGSLEPAEMQTITTQDVSRVLQRSTPRYRKHGDEHFDLISAFIKSMRASDPDAAVYYMARMLEAGEDPLYLARRMIRFASEDVGLADNNAMLLAVQAFQASHFIGMPECTTSLAQAALYLAIAPKSNRVYKAYGLAKEQVERHPQTPVPLKLRNPVTAFLKSQGYGADYHYPHEEKGAFRRESCLPEEIEGVLFYVPSERGKEKKIREYLSRIWVRDYPEEK
ncbi:MAG TPA: replication-associated recombination protein A [Thermotogota bacterium]|nr:replication-associated recombination protein A [Thermotogota bacterium]